jgi:hypothetical protein
MNLQESHSTADKNHTHIGTGITEVEKARDIYIAALIRIAKN